MKRNIASQIIGAEMITAADGTAFTGSVTCYVEKDNGSQTLGSVGSGVCTHKGNGKHNYTPSQAETNGDYIAWTFIGTGAVPATIQVYPTFPQSGDVALVATETRLAELDAGNIPTDLSALSTLLNAIDNSTQLAARFTEIKGAGWTNQTLLDIRAAITAISGLEGARTITVQVYETGGTTPIPDDTIAIYNSDQSQLLGVIKTDSNGQITFGRDDGTYKLVSQKAQVVFTVPETIVVTQDETFTIYGTAQTYPAPANPDACNVYCDLKDFGLDPKEGVTFTARLTTTPQAVNGTILNAEAWSRDTNAAGRAVLTLPQGVKFTIHSNALGGDSKTIRIDTAALSSLVLANQIT